MNGAGLCFGGFGNFFWKFHSWEFLSEDFSGEFFMKTDYDDVQSYAYESGSHFSG